MSTKRKIILRGPFEYYEFPADAALTPGDYIRLNSDGEVARNSVVTVGVPHYAMFAEADTLQGKTIDDDYAAGDIVRCIVPQRGAVVHVTLAVSQTIVIGDVLAPDNAGNFIKLNQGTSAEGMLVAKEAVTTDGSTKQRIEAYVL